MTEQGTDGFKSMLHRLKDDKQELMRLEAQARREQDWDKHDLITEVLDERHAGWDIPNSLASVQSGRRTPYETSFRGKAKVFPDAKQAYIWIMERFVAAKEIDLSEPGWEERFVNPRKARKNISRTLGELFVRSPHLRSDASTWHRLSNGWYLNVNLKNEDKLDVLISYAVVAGIKTSEWDWRGVGEVRRSLADILGAAKADKESQRQKHQS